MSIFLSTATNTVTLEPRFDLQENKRELFVDHTTLGGQFVNFDYGEFNRFFMTLLYVPASDAQLMNQWHEDQTELNFFLDGTNFTVKSISNRRPFVKVERPYSNLRTGTLNLGQV